MSAKRLVIGRCAAEIGEWPGYGYTCGRPAYSLKPARNWGDREIPVCGIHARVKSVSKAGIR